MPIRHDDRMSEIEIRHVRAFLTVVDRGGFTAAAAELRITQPALSRTVADLERRLGERLLDRDHRPVQPTRAGSAFLRQARRLLAVHEETVTALDATPGVLRVGFAWNAAGERTTTIVRTFESDHPDVRVVLRRIDTATAGVDDGRCHLAVVRTPPRSPRLDSAVIGRESRVVALAVTHPLSGRESLELDDVRDDPLVVNPVAGTTSPQLWAAPAAGRPLVEVRNTAEWMHAVALERGIGVTVTSTAAFHAHPEVRFVPLRDAPALDVLAIWPRRGAHPLTSDFVAAARDVTSR
jgi:DNA-binding transcriptional LysR family regulator